MKTLPPPEEPMDDCVATTVVDSDDEHDYPAPAPAPVEPPAPTPVVEPVAVAVEEVAPKKKIVRKKADA
jgi:hypothetical protein